MNFWLVNMCWPFSQVVTQSYIRDSLAKSRFSMAWLQNLMRSRICVYLMFQWLKTILIWCISKTLRLLIDYQTSIGFSQKSKFCYFLQISLPNSLGFAYKTSQNCNFLSFLKPFLNLFALSPHYDMFTVLKCYHRLFIAKKLRSACLKYAFLWKLKYPHNVSIATFTVSVVQTMNVSIFEFP